VNEVIGYLIIKKLARRYLKTSINTSTHDVIKYTNTLYTILETSFRGSQFVNFNRLSEYLRVFRKIIYFSTYDEIIEINFVDSPGS